MTVTLVLPPLTQLNTPYPSISYLAHFLKQHGIDATQRDLGLELILDIFSVAGLTDVFTELETHEALPDPAWQVLAMREQHLRVIDSVIGFLQGRDTSLATRIVSSDYLPTGPRLQRADLEAFGPMGSHDAARYLATLYLEDLADLITSCIDPGFGLARYHPHLATGAKSFAPLWDRLHQTTVIDRYLDRLCDSLQGPLVGLSVPFPGNLYAALRLGMRLKKRGMSVLLGGGYVNTELRDVEEPRLWECVDALTYDDGEGPLLAYLGYFDGGKDVRHRTRTAEGLIDEKHERPTFTHAPHYGTLPLDRYLQTVDTLNPAHRLWADGRWNKITLAHGCYWRRCTFCDVKLDYIQHYQNSEVATLVDNMERLIAETGQRGFHFVDEAAPPRMLKLLAMELLRRNVDVTLWGNIRFEKAFTHDVCRLLAAAGVIAVTGGLEVANERLLGLIDKGVTVAQVAHAASAFRRAGILVHAYLMYGFPTQTEQETIDSMELVRQMFQERLISSAFWHRFVLTRHAPVSEDPTRFRIRVAPDSSETFARNDLQHEDPEGANHDVFDDTLPLALSSWMQGRELGRPVHHWFEQPMVSASVAPNTISRATSADDRRLGERLLWIGGEPLGTDDGLQIYFPGGVQLIQGTRDELGWLSEVLTQATPAQEPLSFSDARAAFPGDWPHFASRWRAVREAAMLRI